MAKMEATIYDSSWNILGIVDDYESLIWTERYSEAGDFELYGAIGSTISKYCSMGCFVKIPESKRAMIIEAMEIAEEEGTKSKILVSGRSLESLFFRRIVWDQTVFNTAADTTVQAAIKRLVNENAISPSDSNRVIPNLIFEESTDPAITSLSFESAQFTGNTLYDAIKQFADAFEIGFKIEVDDSYRMIFKLFSGKDRSFSQNTLPYVVYSKDYDNIVSSNFKNNITNYSNVALVAGEGEGNDRRKIEYYETESTPSGMARYEMFVDARDISSTVSDGQGGSTQLSDEDYIAELQTRGSSKLSEVSYDYAFDAQIDTLKSYQYGVDYEIGDILQLIGILGLKGQMRITEFIRCMDSGGYSAYPQFKIIDFN